MRFVVNDVAATPKAGGVYSILFDFYMDVLNKDHVNQWIFILAGKYFPESENVKIIVRNDLKKSKIKKVIFEKYLGAKFINKFNPDVYISLQNIATFGVKAPTKIVYLHQPIPFQKQKKFSFFKKNERKLAFYQYQVGKIIKSSLSKEKPIIIVQTKWMKKDVIEQTQVPQENIIISHPKVNVEKDLEINKNISNAKNGFLYPASNFLYKNHETINRAIEYLNDNNIQNFQVIFTLNSNQLPYHNKQIKYIGHVDRKKIMNMYNTHVLIFPSYIESFGLPLIEAALHADVVLAADTEFSRELLSNYSNVYYYKYDNAQKLADLMKKVINHEIISDGKPLKMKDNGETLYEVVNNII